MVAFLIRIIATLVMKRDWSLDVFKGRHPQVLPIA